MSGPANVSDMKPIQGDANAPATPEELEKQEAVEEFTGEKSAGQLTMYVKVHSPFKQYYEGRAFSLSAENATGPFDILPHHHNFISLLQPCEMVVRTVNNDDRRILISGGLMHVKADKVVVFLDV